MNLLTWVLILFFLMSEDMVEKKSHVRYQSPQRRQINREVRRRKQPEGHWVIHVGGIYLKAEEYKSDNRNKENIKGRA